jgi:hypothetical protein
MHQNSYKVSNGISIRVSSLLMSQDPANSIARALEVGGSTQEHFKHLLKLQSTVGFRSFTHKVYRLQ